MDVSMRSMQEIGENGGWLPNTLLNIKNFFIAEIMLVDFICTTICFTFFLNAAICLIGDFI